VSTTPQDPFIVDALFAERPEAAQGRNYVNLGYLPAHPAALHAFMANPLAGASLFSALDPDSGGFAQGIVDWDSFDLVIVVSGDQTDVRWWVEQVGIQGETDLVAATSAAISPYVRPYYEVAGQAAGSGQL